MTTPWSEQRTNLAHPFSRGYLRPPIDESHFGPTWMRLQCKLEKPVIRYSRLPYGRRGRCPQRPVNPRTRTVSKCRSRQRETSLCPSCFKSLLNDYHVTHRSPVNSNCQGAAPYEYGSGSQTRAMSALSASVLSHEGIGRIVPSTTAN